MASIQNNQPFPLTNFNPTTNSPNPTVTAAMACPAGLPGTRRRLFRAVYRCCSCSRVHHHYLSHRRVRSMDSDQNRNHPRDIGKGCPTEGCNHRFCVQCRQIIEERLFVCWSCDYVVPAFYDEEDCMECEWKFEGGACVMDEWMQTSCEHKEEFGWKKGGWGCDCHFGEDNECFTPLDRYFEKIGMLGEGGALEGHGLAMEKKMDGDLEMGDLKGCFLDRDRSLDIRNDSSEED